VKTILRMSVLSSLAMLALAGCPKNDETDETKPATTAKAANTAAPADTTPPPATSSKPPTKLTGDDGDKPPAGDIRPRVKAEVDGKEGDGASGATLTAAGARAAFTVPSDWKSSRSGAYSVAVAGDEKTRFAAGPLGSGETGESKAPDGASALGLTDCSWGTAESVTVGKDKLVGSAADGVCKRSGGLVRTAYVAFSAEGVLAIGGWDDAGGNDAAVFAAFRSAKKAAVGTGDASGIAACCAALRQNAANAPLQHKGALIAAAGACDALRSDPRGRAALGGVRAMASAAGVPAACR
jgi:hypothetical protein